MRPIQAAENKVAEAIKKLYNNHKATAKYDKEGLATVFVAKEQLEASGVSALLPQAGKSGITIQFYRQDHAPLFSMRYLLEQKVKSLCQAAKIRHPAYSDAIEAALTQLLNDIDVSTANPDHFSKIIKENMDLVIQETIKALYNVIKPEKNKLTQFVKDIIVESNHHRVSDASILIFDEKTGRVSFDEVISPVAAHDRGLAQQVANLSCVYEGFFTDQSVRLTHSLIKHASLPPITALTSMRLADLSEDKIENLISTCNHMEEVATAMAKLKKHGGESQGKLDWTYQLLTTNALNSDKQATTYGYTIKAANLMQGFMADGTHELNLHVFNAGLNTIANFNLGQKTDTQRRENRKAYLHITEVFAAQLNALPEEMDTVKSAFSSIRNMHQPVNKVDPTELDLLRIACEKAKAILVYNAKQFNEYRKAYNASHDHKERTRLKLQMKDCVKMAKSTNDHLRHYTYQLENAHKRSWRREKKRIHHAVQGFAQSSYFQQLKNKVDSGDADATDKLLQLSAIVYKCHMDELYYSGTYRQPQNAALFNAYLSAFQRITGMIASTGCKSANDRTYVARIVLAAMQGRDLAAMPLPPAYHQSPEALQSLKSDLARIALTNTALLSAIHDTGGSTPKVDGKKFSILDKLPSINLKSLFVLGGYAAHKMKTPKFINQLIARLQKSILGSGLAKVGVFARLEKTSLQVTDTPKSYKNPRQ